MDIYTALPKISDSVEINKLIMQYGVMRAKAHAEAMDTFMEASTKANLLIMEVFKGLISSHRI